MSNLINYEPTWDPMKEDYLNPTFNSYSHGPGSRLDRHLQPCFSRTSREKSLFKLHIRNIPSGLTERGIKNVFLHFGNPIEIYRQPPGCGPGWGFVSYATHVEAELAIRKLNNMPPFYFRVQFARSAEEKERIRQEQVKNELLQTVLEGESYPVQDERAPFNFFSRGIGRGRALPFPLQRQMKTRPGKCVEQNNRLDFEELGYCSSYITGPYHEANKMVMQGVNLTTNSTMGRHIVSMGRGYCIAKDNEHVVHRSNKGKSETVYDRVNNSIYEFGTKLDVSGLSGNCLYCNKSTVHYCRRCRSWYCSRECQVSDWPCHRSDCTVEKSENKSVRKTVLKSDFIETSASIVRSVSELHCISNEVENDSEQFKDIEGNRHEAATLESSESSKSLVEVNISRYKELPGDKFTRVKINVIEGPTECWVQLQDSETQLSEVTSALNNETESFSLDRLEPGVLCSVLNEGCWYRGKILQVEPELKILYIDFGNVENCTPDQLRALPESVKDISALSFKIKLAEGTSERYNLSKVHELNIKSVDKSDDAIVVHIEGEVYPEKQERSNTVPVTSEQHSPVKVLQEEGCAEEVLPKSVVLNLKPGLKGGCQLRYSLTGGAMTATVVYPAVRQEFSTLFHTLKSFKSSPETEHYKPSIGEIVVALVESEDIWLRAHVLAVDKLCYLVSLCDMGYVTTVKKVDVLPENLLSIPEFAVKCNIANVDSSKIEEWCKEQRRFIFTVLSVDSTHMSATCSLQLDTEQVVEAVFTRWIVEDTRLRTVLLQNNDMVNLSVFFDHKSLFIRPATESARETLSKLQQDVGFHCLKASDMTEMPHKNEVVACLFEPDGNYYRAQVLSIEEETVKVTYIDFGNIDCVSLDKLKPLPEDLKKMQTMSVKVSLRNTEEKSMTISACKLLTHLVGNEVEMTLILNESFKDGVELILPSGENLSDKINACLDSESGNNLSDKKIKEYRIFTEDDLQYLELPLNKTIDFAVLHKLDSVSFMGCDANGGEILNYVHDGMSTDINKYCNSLLETSYVPRVGELCFARSEDALWYRAVCISDGISRENNVLFLDFGNMAFVDKIDIRKITLEYAEIPVVALFCMLKDLQTNSATDAQKKCVEELVQENKIYKANVISNVGHGVYIIEFPHVTEVLTKNNLLSPVC